MQTKIFAVRGVLLTWVGKACAMVIAFFATPIYIRELGDAGYGVWSIIMSLAAYFMLFDLGIGKAGAKYISQYDAEHQPEAVRRVVASALSLYARLAVALLLVTVVVAWWFPTIFKSAEHHESVTFWAVLLVGLSVSVQIFGGAFFSGIVARKRFDLANAISNGSGIAVQLSVLLAVLAGGGLIWMTAGMLLVYSLTLVAILCCAVLVVHIPIVSRRDVDAQQRTTLLRFGSLTVVTQWATRLGLSSGSVIIGMVLGAPIVAYYAVAELLTQKCSELATTVHQIVMPVASQYDAQGNREGILRLLIVPSRLLMAMAMLFITGMFTIGYPFLGYWISPEYAEKSYPVLCVLSLALLVKLPGDVVQSALVGMGRVGLVSRLAIVEGATIIILGFLLVTISGRIDGMAWAIVGGQFLAAGVLVPMFACRAIHHSLARYWMQIALPAAAAVAPGLALALLLAHVHPPQNVFACLLHGLLITAVTAISTFILCLDAASREACLRAVIRTPSSPSRQPKTDQIAGELNE